MNIDEHETRWTREYTARVHTMIFVSCILLVLFDPSIAAVPRILYLLMLNIAATQRKPELLCIVAFVIGCVALLTLYGLFIGFAYSDSVEFARFKWYETILFLAHDIFSLAMTAEAGVEVNRQCSEESRKDALEMNNHGQNMV